MFHRGEKNWCDLVLNKICWTFFWWKNVVFKAVFFSRFCCCLFVCCLISGNPGFMVFTFCNWIDFDWHVFHVLKFRPSHLSVCCIYFLNLKQFLCVFYATVFTFLWKFCCCSKWTTVWHCVCWLFIEQFVSGLGVVTPSPCCVHWGRGGLTAIGHLRWRQTRTLVNKKRSKWISGHQFNRSMADQEWCADLSSVSFSMCFCF